MQKEIQGVVRKYVSFNFTDPFQGGIHVEDEQEERVRALYDISENRCSGALKRSETLISIEYLQKG